MTVKHAICSLSLASAIFLAGCNNDKEKEHAEKPKNDPAEKYTKPKTAVASEKAAPAKTAEPEWTSLFDGKTLGKWAVTNFGGEGEVKVENGAILLPMGATLTGVTYTGDDFPKMNYEIALEAQRVDGSDFFCGLTFPVDKTHASLILGGWGGTVTGISSLDEKDASSNDTTKYLRYELKKWYRVRMRVTEDKFESWLDDEKIVDIKTTGHKIDIRIEVDKSRPLGIATWQTTSAVRNIRIRKLSPSEIGH